MFLCAQLYAKEGLFERHHHLTTVFLDPYFLAVVHLYLDLSGMLVTGVYRGECMKSRDPSMK